MSKKKLLMLLVSIASIVLLAAIIHYTPIGSEVDEVAQKFTFGNHICRLLRAETGELNCNCSRVSDGEARMLQSVIHGDLPKYHFDIHDAGSITYYTITDPNGNKTHLTITDSNCQDLLRLKRRGGN